MRIKSVFKKTFLSLRNRNFRLFFFGQLISNIGNWLTNVALILLVLKLTNSGLDVGWLAACQYGPILLFSAYAGSIVDRVNKRKLLFVTQTLEMAQSAALAVLAFMPHPPLAGFFILAIAGGIFLAFDNPVRRAFVSEMVQEDDLSNAVVLYSLIVNVSRIFGPALAGLLVVTMGFGWAFTFDAISYLAVLLCLAMMRVSELHLQEVKSRVQSGVMDGLRYVRSVPSLWISLVMLAIIGTFTYNFSVTLPLFVTRSLHSSTATFTILYSVFSCGAVVCSLFVAHRKLVKIHHMISGAAVMGLAAIFLSVTKGVWIAGLAIFFTGMSTVLYSTATTTLVQLESKREMLGRVLALQTVLMIGTTPIGGPISGWVADVAGARVPIAAGGLIALLAAGFGYWGMLHYQHKEKPVST